MAGKISVTVLVENLAGRPPVLGAHGLAYWIDTGSTKILFDTGQGMTLTSNAAAMRVPLAAAGVIVLSHGHYDHTGGLALALEMTALPRVFAHPVAFASKYSMRGGKARQIGIPLMTEAKVRAASRELVATTAPTEIADGVYVTGEIPRRTDFEDTGGAFFLDGAGRVPDPLIDDQAIYFDTDAGVVILLGCAHAGVVNTLRHIRRLTGDRPIASVIGGMHLLHASAERISRTVDSLAELELKRLVPMHCTGMPARLSLAGAFPAICEHAGAGSAWRFDRSD